MNTPRKQMFMMVAAFLVAGCAGSDGSSTAASSPVSPTASKTPSPTPTSAFCLNLDTFQLGVLAFRGDVLRTAEGTQQPDLAELRRKASVTTSIGEEMRDTAPPDIAKDFETVLKAVDEAGQELKPGGNGRKAGELLFGKRNQAAFEAVRKYNCR
jgi:hypothetical protein